LLACSPQTAKPGLLSAGLLTYSRIMHLPVRYFQTVVYCISLKKSLQQRELLPIFTAFPIISKLRPTSFAKLIFFIVLETKNPTFVGNLILIFYEACFIFFF